MPLFSKFTTFWLNLNGFFIVLVEIKLLYDKNQKKVYIHIVKLKYICIRYSFDNMLKI
jgi:hypothetical protein